MKLDHIVIGTRNLEEGAKYLEDCLRCTLEPGGKHLGFGTHNRLLNLGEGAYLELIALDAEQVQLNHRPPFGLGESTVQQKLNHGPALLAWVVASDSIEKTFANQAAIDLAQIVGKPTPMHRGQLAWTIAHRTDGLPVPFGFPTVIDWGGIPHPSQRLAKSTVALDSLHLLIDHKQQQPETTQDIGDWLTPLLQSDRRLMRHTHHPKLNEERRLLASLQIGEGEFFEI